MSTLGSIAGQLDQGQQLLRELNAALIVLEAHLLGRAADFGFTDQDLQVSRTRLLDFAYRLRMALGDETTSGDLQSLVHRIKSGMKPLEDWKADLDALVKHLGSNQDVSDDVLRVLEDVLSLLDTEFADDLRRLYAR
jgi:hypothetical protein